MKLDAAYELLGATDKTGDEELRGKFRSRLKQLHPDICKQPDAQILTQNIIDAYKRIKNSRRKEPLLSDDSEIALALEIKRLLEIPVWEQRPGFTRLLDGKFEELALYTEAGRSLNARLSEVRGKATASWMDKTSTKLVVAIGAPCLSVAFGLSASVIGLPVMLTLAFAASAPVAYLYIRQTNQEEAVMELDYTHKELTHHGMMHFRILQAANFSKPQPPAAEPVYPALA